MLNRLKDFCGNVSFWDEEELLNSTWPDLKDCFHQTALTWIPCAFLWISAPAYLFYLSRLTTWTSKQTTWLIVLKQIVPLGLFVLSVVQLISTLVWSRSQKAPASLYLAHGLTIISYLYASVLVYLERRRRVVTSSILFLYWMLVTFFYIFPFYTAIAQGLYVKNAFRFSLVVIHFFLVLITFILQFFSNAQVDWHKGYEEKKVSPVLWASYPSQLTYWWANRMLKLGFKRPLTLADLFPLEPNNQSHNIVARFSKKWQKENERIHQINEKRSHKLRTKHQEETKDDYIPLMPSQNSLHEHDIKAKAKNDDSKQLLRASDSSSQHPTPVGLNANEGNKSSREENDGHIGDVNRTGDSVRIKKGSKPSNTASYGSGKGTTNTENDSKHIISDENFSKELREERGARKSSKVGGGNTHNKPSEKDKKETSAFKKNSRNKNVATMSLFRVLLRTFWVPYFLTQIQILVCNLLQFVNPIVLKALLEYVNNRDKYQPWVGYVLACSFFVSSNIYTIVIHQAIYRVMTLGVRIKSATISAIYQKALTMNLESQRQATVGEIVNLMAIDSQKLQEVIVMIHHLWNGPLVIAIALYQLWALLGVSTLAGVALLLMVIPANGVAAHFMKRLQMSTMKLRDRRIKLITEVLNGIKMLKLYAWEPLFEEKILNIRNQELKNIRKSAIFQSVIIFVWMFVPFLVTLASFSTYILVSDAGYLDPTTAFVSLSLFNIIRVPLITMPAFIPPIIQANVSLNRLDAFFQWNDIDPDNLKRDSTAVHAVAIQNGTFTWDAIFSQPTLQDISLYVPEGKLVSIVGPVGCGKSSLLAALLGEMNKLSGSVTVKSSFAYVPQVAWIQNSTARDNILFGRKLSHRRYNQIIKACALDPDFEILPGGDMTEIGEKGINLSGGQKQRVSLARAVYSDANIYLFDDPLSAVDSHVGKHIFQNVLGNQGILTKKTRILVTHGVHWLPMTDLIVVMNSGSISEIGTYEELLGKNGAFAEFLNTYMAQGDKSDGEVKEVQAAPLKSSLTSLTATSDEERSKDFGSTGQLHVQLQQSRILESQISHESEFSEKAVQETSKLVTDEESETGSVSLKVYILYIKRLGFWGCLTIMLCYIMYLTSLTMSSIWLSYWTDDSTLANISLAGTPQYSQQSHIYMGGYGALGAAQAIFFMSFNIIFWIHAVKASRNLHMVMLSTILKSPMAFFDTTPNGRIINRFSRDVEACDFMLPLSLYQTVVSLGSMIMTIILISFGSPIFLAVLVPLGVAYKIIQKFYISSSRQLKRLESTTRSPIFSHFTESIQGATSIRAYGVSGRFIQESQERVDTNITCYVAFLISQRWLCVRIEVLSSLVTLSAALLAIINHNLSGGLVGLSVTYAMNMTMSLNLLILMSSELEGNIVSVERIKEYSEQQTEAAWKGPKALSEKWPEEGRIEFQDYQTRYRPGLGLAIHGLSCSIRGGEKVGIVGRTGAGKSSLTLALFRMIEAAGGSIVVDGERLADLGLHDLRGRLTILPQDAFVFSGTLRVNLDPSGQHSDNEIWMALDHSHLSSFVREVPGQLDYECGEGGQNLSVGQRQLICLTRSLLRKSKVLVLDEATAAVDMETDDLIQQTIRSEFKDSTVLTIAHRLNTIMDYDRIMVLDQGTIKEFASPRELLAIPDSHFYSMAKSAGLV